MSLIKFIMIGVKISISDFLLPTKIEIIALFFLRFDLYQLHYQRFYQVMDDQQNHASYSLFQNKFPQI